MLVIYEIQMKCCPRNSRKKLHVAKMYCTLLFHELRGCCFASKIKLQSIIVHVYFLNHSIKMGFIRIQTTESLEKERF